MFLEVMQYMCVLDNDFMCVKYGDYLRWHSQIMRVRYMEHGTDML